MTNTEPGTRTDRGLVQSWPRLLTGIRGVFVCTVLCGCTATLGTETDATDPIDSKSSTSFVCNDTLSLPDTGWRKLTHRQYERTLRDVLSATLGQTEGLVVFGEIELRLAQLPIEERFKLPEDLHGSYRRLSQTLDQQHVDNWYALATDVAAQLTSSAHLARTVGTCATSPSSVDVGDCVRGFVQRWGRLVLRRPLTSDEVKFFAGFYGKFEARAPEGFSDVVAGLLSAPQFLYRVEHGSNSAGSRPGSFKLTAHELAARLSYHLWDTMPDEELAALADSGALLERSTLEAQVDRMLAHPRARETAREFFRDWLKLEDLPALDQLLGTPTFDAFVGADAPTAQLRENLINEVLDLLEHLIFSEGSGVSEVFTTNQVFPKTADVAALYGSPISGEGLPVTLPDGERPGLLTRAAFLATGTPNTRPILKGVFIRTNMLCDPIPAPPDNAAASPPEISPTLTTRQVVEELTEEPGAGCANCHVGQINPLGFATENFDALGRVRTEQRLFDTSGNFLGAVPIDTRTTVEIDGSATEIADAQALMKLLVDSRKMEACLSRHYFRYSFGRWEDLEADGCALEHIRTELIEGGSIAAMLRAIALAPEFGERVFD